jgi:hypothetical protein
VQKPERLAGAVDHAKHAKLGDDLVHRPARRVHVPNEGRQPLFVLVNLDAHSVLP